MEPMIFVNLPVADLAASVAFYAAVGAVNDPDFTDGSAAMMSFSRSINLMLLTHARFATFTTREIADTRRQVQVLLTISRPDRAAVDATVDRAVAAGGTADPSPTDEFGSAMYGRSFADPDGHLWGVMWMDRAAMVAHMARPGA